MSERKIHNLRPRSESLPKSKSLLNVIAKQIKKKAKKEKVDLKKEQEKEQISESSDESILSINEVLKDVPLFSPGEAISGDKSIIDHKLSDEENQGSETYVRQESWDTPQSEAYVEHLARQETPAASPKRKRFYEKFLKAVLKKRTDGKALRQASSEPRISFGGSIDFENWTPEKKTTSSRKQLFSIATEAEINSLSSGKGDIEDLESDEEPFASACNLTVAGLENDTEIGQKFKQLVRQVGVEEEGIQYLQTSENFIGKKEENVDNCAITGESKEKSDTLDKERSEGNSEDTDSVAAADTDKQEKINYKASTSGEQTINSVIGDKIRGPPLRILHDQIQFAVTHHRTERATEEGLNKQTRSCDRQLKAHSIRNVVRVEVNAPQTNQANPQEAARRKMERNEIINELAAAMQLQQQHRPAYTAIKSMHKFCKEIPTMTDDFATQMSFVEKADNLAKSMREITGNSPNDEIRFIRELAEKVIPRLKENLSDPAIVTYDQFKERLVRSTKMDKTIHILENEIYNFRPYINEKPMQIGERLEKLFARYNKALRIERHDEDTIKAKIDSHKQRFFFDLPQILEEKYAMMINAKGCRDFDEMLKYMFEIGGLSSMTANSSATIYAIERKREIESAEELKEMVREMVENNNKQILNGIKSLMARDDEARSEANTWPVVPRNQYQRGGYNPRRPNFRNNQDARGDSRRNSWSQGSERGQNREFRGGYRYSGPPRRQNQPSFSRNYANDRPNQYRNEMRPQQQHPCNQQRQNYSRNFNQANINAPQHQVATRNDTQPGPSTSQVNYAHQEACFDNQDVNYTHQNNERNF